MDWYYESGGDELVPTEQDVSDSFQFSDRWNQWGICSTGSKFSDEVEIDLFSSEREQSLNASGLCSVFSEDQPFVPRHQSSQNDGNFMHEQKKAKVDDLSEHSTIDVHCGKTEMWDFSLSAEQENKHIITLHNPLISDQKISESPRAHVVKVSAHTQNDSTAGCGNDNLSVEESLLLDFEFLMKQMSQKTRYCFRDALYRLARNSERPISDQNVCDDNATPDLWELSTTDESARYRSMEESEAHTNTIDRTVASLMFSNMNFSLGDHQQA